MGFDFLKIEEILIEIKLINKLIFNNLTLLSEDVEDCIIPAELSSKINDKLEEIFENL